MLKKIKSLNKKIKAYYQEENKKVAIIYGILRLLVILCLIREIFNGNYHNVFLCFLTLLLFLIPFLVADKLKVKIPHTLQIIILLFIFSAEILGEIQNFYNIFSNWDLILHTLNGFLSSAIGFSLIDILNQTKQIHFKMSPIFVALVSFCFSMTVGVFWEFFEFSADKFLNTDMQKDTIVTKISSVNLEGATNFKPKKVNEIEKTIITSKEKNIIILKGYLDIGLIDTIEDLLVNFIGAFSFSTLGYFYIKKRNKYKSLENFIVKKKKA